MVQNRFWKIYNSIHLKLILWDLLATIGDVAGILAGDDLRGEDVTLVVSPAGVNVFAIGVLADAQHTRGDGALAQACWDPTVCT